MAFITLVLAFCLFSSIQAAPTLPETVDADGVEWIGPIRKCPIGSDSGLDECLEKIVKDLTPLVASGLEELGVMPLDPFRLQKFAYEQNLGPVGSIKVLSKNIQIDGLTKYSTMKFKVDTEKQVMNFVYEVPKLRVNANYKLGGNIFFFPLTGTGPAAIEMYKVRAIGHMNFKKIEKEDGTTVVQLKDTVMDKMDVGDMKMRIHGLFDGKNAILSASVHLFANQYGAQIFEVIRPEIASFTGDILTNKILNPALDKLPYLAEYF